MKNLFEKFIKELNFLFKIFVIIMGVQLFFYFLEKGLGITITGDEFRGFLKGMFCIILSDMLIKDP